MKDDLCRAALAFENARVADAQSGRRVVICDCNRPAVAADGGIGSVAQRDKELLGQLVKCITNNVHRNSFACLARGKCKRARRALIIATSFCSSIRCRVVHRDCLACRSSQAHGHRRERGSTIAFANSDIADAELRNGIIIKNGALRPTTTDHSALHIGKIQKENFVRLVHSVADHTD